MNRLYIQAAGKNSEDWRTISIHREVDAQHYLDLQRQLVPGLKWRMVGPDEISNKTTADWSISLDLQCPYCNEMFDLVAGEWPEDVEAMEHGTDRTKGYEVECHGCDQILSVDFTY